MKLILILTIYSSVAFARFNPSANSYLPGFQYQQSSGYDSYQKDSESDQRYLSKLGVSSNPSYGGYFPGPYSPNNGWSQLSGGGAIDLSQYYDSRKVASENDLSYFNSIASNGGGYYDGSSIPTSIQSIPSPTPYLPIDGSGYDYNQYYNSKKAASEEDERYFLNAAGRKPNSWSPSFGYDRNIYAPSSGSGFDITQGYDSRQAASESDQSYYLNAGVRNPNWWSPSYGYRPNQYVTPSNVYPSPAPVGGNSFDFSQGYDSHQAASESDQSYYMNAGIRNPNWWSPNYGYRPNTYVVPSNIGGGYSLYPPSAPVGGNSFDFSQGYDSRQAASESDQSYYLNAGVRNPNWWSPTYGYRPNTYVPAPTIGVPNIYAPSVSGGGNSFDNEMYGSRPAGNELDQGYYLNGGVRNPNWLSPSYEYRPNTYVPPPTIGVPNIYAPSVSGGGNSFDISQAYDSHQAASESDQSYYLNAGLRNPNWWSPSYGYRPNKYIAPLSIGSGYNPNIYAPGAGNSYDFNQGYNSRQAASESDESYFAKAGLSNPNWWSSGASYNPIPEYKPIRYAPVIGSGNSYNFNQGYNSREAASEKDESYYGKAAYNNGYPFSVGGALWSKPQSYNVPLSSQRVVSENFRDSESQSLNDQSSFLNKYISNNLGGLSESAASQSFSNNRESDTAYDFKDIGKTIYGYK